MGVVPFYTWLLSSLSAGKIDHDYKKGDTLTFTVTANFEVESFDGSKSLLISNLGEFFVCFYLAFSPFFLYFNPVSLLLYLSDFSGSSFLIVFLTHITTGEFGGKNPFLGVAYVVVGSISLMFALLFVVKQTVAPRAKADASLLNWT